MNAFVVGFGVFGLLFTGALVGMALRRALPENHFIPEAKDTVRLAIGLVVTMTGLVLGMLVSSAKTSYDSQKNKVADMSSQIILADYLLRVYGPDATPLRLQERQIVQQGVDRIWPPEGAGLPQLKPRNSAQDFYEQLQTLVPKNETQAAIKAQVLSMTLSMQKTNSLLFLESEQSSASIPLIMTVTSWLLAIFISFGIFAPRNGTVIATLIVCALAVSAAIFIIIQMYSPFTGVLRIAPTAVHDALAQMASP
jgi:hypothetical protein